MIIFKTLKWNNFFSYGKDNEIDFTQSPVTQLVGLNGVGKTSIPLILQEVAYGKNVKKIIKANLANRNTSGGIFAELVFLADNIEYKVRMTRTSKLTVELYKDGEDISSHTAPATMKTLEGILNLDFDTFSQLVYQSSKSNLQFLTATDTQRKKFLITLFNLERYIEIFEQLKTILTDINKEISSIQGKYSVYEDWLEQHKNDDLTERELKPYLEINKDDIDKLALLKNRKNEAQNINKKINSNNQYKEEIKNIDHSLLTKTLFKPEGINELQQDLTKLRFQKSEKEKTLKNAEGKKPFCPVCKQSIDISDSKKLAENTRSEIEKINLKVSDINAQLKILNEQSASDKQVLNTIAEFEKLSGLIDHDRSIVGKYSYRY
jgi:DNA repair exonuclease SbcCD ATPase subunit